MMLRLQVCEKSSGFFAGDAGWAQPALAAHAPPAPLSVYLPAWRFADCPPPRAAGAAAATDLTP